VFGPGGVESDVTIALPGVFNVANALAAIVALVEAGVGLAAAVAGVTACPGPPGRMERVEAGQDFTVLVDYSHKPGAVEAVLTVLREVTQGRLMIVLGCGGDRDRGKRPLMGKIARQLADRVIVTSDNPRSEDPGAIIDEILAGAGSDVLHDADRRVAISEVIAGAGAGDVVVIAGKGHEQGQEFAGGRKIPFDDCDVAREVLRTALAAR
jgi:UDP-N-acetylmuramoyl-L-alanyl-D-glutamate--2,6-diaminopimelate ligase